MKQIKKILSLILSICILFSITAGLDFSAYALSSSGSCGSNVKYTFNSSTGKLVISGTGAMTDYFISDSPFYYQSGIKTVVINLGVTSIGNYAFSYCTGLTSITIPYSVTSIGDCALSDCRVLTSVTIPDSVTSIGNYAFEHCRGLTRITIPNSVTSIGDSAFYGCSGLTSVSIPDSVTSIGEDAFRYCTGLTSVTIGNSVTNIGAHAFYNCTGLTSVTIPNSVTSIGSSAFSDCTGLSSIIVDKNNKTYDSRNNCNAIIKTSTNSLIVGCKNTVIPDSVTSIGSSAFSYCTGLTSVTIPDSVTSIGSNAFGCCTNLVSIIVDENNKYYDSRNNCNAVIETSTNSLVVGCKNTVIPDSVTSIGSYAFRQCNGLTSITIPNNVTSIGEYAFCDCKGLTSVTIPSSVGNIGSWAFSGCSYLTSITIPNGVTSISRYAFYWCTNLTSITIPDSVISIGYVAFGACDNLQDVYYMGSEDDWKNISIDSNNTYLTNATIHYHSHIYSVVEKLDKTCSTDGYEIYKCECGKEYKEIYKAGHEYVLLEAIEPDCENIGINIYECEVCGESYIEEPEALGHNMVVDNAIAPTCTETGLTQGSHCSRCGMVDVKQEIVESLGGHKPLDAVKENIVDSTCIEDGSYDEVIYCSVCNETLSRETFKIDALGHSFTDYISDSNATCLDDGTKTAKCDRCDETETIADIDSKLGHSYVATITKPTCTEQGYTTYNCSRCEDSYVGDYTEALGHTPKVIDSVAPTCTETGLSEGSSCSVCGVILIEQQIISANGHSYELYRTTATCEKAGYNVYKCSVCSGTKSEKVDAHHTCDTFVGVVDGELSYSCSACGKEYTQSASEIFEKWDSSVINASAEEHPELDVVNDGVINAKDYALLNHIKNYGY